MKIIVLEKARQVYKILPFSEAKTAEIELQNKGKFETVVDGHSVELQIVNNKDWIENI